MRVFLVLALCFSLCGCWVALVGVGAEAGYLASQEERSAGETLDDQRITAEVKSRLVADQGFAGLDINVDTFKKVVTLRGFVARNEQAERAVEIASSVSGVRDVESRLFLK